MMLAIPLSSPLWGFVTFLSKELGAGGEAAFDRFRSLVLLVSLRIGMSWCLTCLNTGSFSFSSGPFWSVPWSPESRLEAVNPIE
jgi:hypothetical protein